MHTKNLRNRVPISYYEPDEPSMDEYIYCEECSDYVYEYCALHGPLLVIPDDKIRAVHKYPSYVPRAALTVPRQFLHIAASIIPGAGLGIFATRTLPRGVRFGPYRGRLTDRIDSPYCWQLYSSHNKPRRVVDAGDAQRSNWMRYVNCARHALEQNLVAFQYKGQLYYRTIKIVPKFTELLVFYGTEYAESLNINVKAFNSTTYYQLIEHEIPAPQNTNNELTQCIQEYKNQADSSSDYRTNELEETNLTVQDTFISSEGLIVDNFRYIDEYKPETVDLNTHSDLFSVAFDDVNNTIKLSFNNITDFEQKICANDNLDIVESTSSRLGTNNISGLNTDMVDSTNNNVFQTLNTNWQCEICSKILSSKKNLKRHKLIHEVNYKFSCDQCTFRTNIKYRLKIHVITHEKALNFKCHQCTYASNSSANLKNHLRKGHNNVTCNFCDYFNSKRSVMENHKKLHDVRNVLKCHSCGYLTKERRGIARHILKKHKK